MPLPKCRGEAAVDVLEAPVGAAFSLEQHLEEIQRQYLRRVLGEAGGIQCRAALLGYRNYQTLAAQLERLGIKHGDR